MNSFRVDVFQKLFHLQFIECFRQIALDPWERQRLSRIAVNCSFTGQKPKKNLQCNHDQLDRRGRKSSSFAITKIFADDR